MTLLPQKINNRRIFYLDIHQGFDNAITIDLKNRVLFIIADGIQNPDLSPFAEWCIDKDVLYVCAAGAACSEADDLFDMAMVIRELEERQLPSWISSTEDILMTTWHHDFEEGFWYATSMATYEEYPIEMVVVANLTKKDYLPLIRELSSRINKRWLPDE